MSRVEVVITGINPVPWKAPQVSVGRKAGKVFPRIYKDAGLDAYQRAIRECVLEAYPDPPTFVSGTRLSVIFGFWRQLDAGMVEGRSRRAHQADTTNLQKSTEDALQGLLFTNDRLNVHVTSCLVAQGPDVEPMIYAHVSDAPPLINDWEVRAAEAQALAFDPPSPPGNVWLVERPWLY